MKYIITKSDLGSIEMFTFPSAVHHDIMAEAISRLKDQNHGDWRRVRRDPISAGFIFDGVCYGKSETLGLNSRSEDTAVFQNSLITS